MDAKQSLSTMRRIIGLLDGLDHADLVYLIERLKQVADQKAAGEGK